VKENCWFSLTTWSIFVEADAIEWGFPFQVLHFRFKLMEALGSSWCIVLFDRREGEEYIGKSSAYNLVVCGPHHHQQLHCKPDLTSDSTTASSHHSGHFRVGSQQCAHWLPNRLLVRDYLLQLNVAEERLVPLDTLASYAQALVKGPLRGGVGAIVDELPYVQLFLSSECDFTIAGQEFTKSGWGFVCHFPFIPTFCPHIS
jgi:hypothetical protein